MGVRGGGSHCFVSTQMGLKGVHPAKKRHKCDVNLWSLLITSAGFVGTNMFFIPAIPGTSLVWYKYVMFCNH